MHFLLLSSLRIDQPNQRQAVDLAHADEILFLRGNDRSAKSFLPDGLFCCCIAFGRIGAIKFLAHDLDVDGTDQRLISEGPLLAAVVDQNIHQRLPQQPQRLRPAVAAIWLSVVPTAPIDHQRRDLAAILIDAKIN